MRQYCRYCAECVAQDDDLVYCEVKARLLSGATAKSTNNCKHYRPNTLDVFSLEHVYTPRESKREGKAAQLDGQISMFGG